MYQLLRKTNQKEVVVGFYFPGLKPTEVTSQLHDMIDQLFLSTSKTIMHGVLMMFDPTLQKGSLNIRGYLGLPISSLEKKSQGRLFVPIPVYHENLSKNVCALEPIARASSPTANGLAPLLSDAEMTEYRMQELSELTQECLRYIEYMKHNSISATPEELADFQHHAQSISQFLAIQGDPMHCQQLETELRDFKTIVQLAEQSKKQIEISDKISFGITSLS
ncbi:hypothetical protein HMI54_014314 [Coelomomyces lativittatus]|nr:hypothetical protein HMI54_014314 [Coelomomyces lativittatus]